MVGNTNGSAIGRFLFFCYAIVLGQKQQGGGWIGTCRRDPFTVFPPQKVTFLQYTPNVILNAL